MFSFLNDNFYQFAADYATTHLMKNLMNKIIEVKKLLDEKTSPYEEPKEVTLSTPENVTPRMKMKINKVESPLNVKPIISVDDSVINFSKSKQDLLSLKKDITLFKNIDNIIINPSSYLLKDGTINFSKLLIDEVLAADKLLIEAAKSTYNIAGNILIITL